MIPNISRRIFSRRRNTTKWQVRFWSPTAKGLQRRWRRSSKDKSRFYRAARLRARRSTTTAKLSWRTIFWTRLRFPTRLRPSIWNFVWIIRLIIWTRSVTQGRSLWGNIVPRRLGIILQVQIIRCRRAARQNSLPRYRWTIS